MLRNVHTVEIRLQNKFIHGKTSLVKNLNLGKSTVLHVAVLWVLRGKVIYGRI